MFMTDRQGLVRNLTYSEQAREVIRQHIFDGTYRPGQRLKEAEVSRDLGISRAPTREAIQTLANEGLVEIAPHRGAVVATFDAVRVRELYEVREALEVMAARMAAEKADDGQLDELRKLLSDTAEVIQEDESIPYPRDLDFHSHLFELAENSRLRILAAEVYAQIRLARLRSGSEPGRAKEAHEEHSTILAAVQRKDPIGAENAMRNHIRRGLENMENILAKANPPVAPSPEPQAR